jgi:4-hydroxybenzoate polyprenyltransferase
MRAYLQLLRVPNIVTSAADVLAGALIVASVFNGSILIGPFILLVFSSCFMYGGGVVLNDVVDASIDAEERPERPIPSGKISQKKARKLAYSLLLLGLICAWLSSFISFIIALMLVGTIILYNHWAKKFHSPGSIVMGLCRSLNLCLGFTLVPELMPNYIWLSVFPLVHIIAVTSLSRGETTGLQRRHVYLLAMIPWVLAMFLFVLAFVHSTSTITPFIFIVFYLFGISFAFLPAIRNPAPSYIGRGVKYGILSLILLNASLVSIYSEWFTASMVALLVLISWLMARSISMT